ncbi:MAG: MoxR family ATPase [Planctomycetales bacterium]|nr:MoxR family ATPase [Planctomycetales bacterium]
MPAVAAMTSPQVAALRKNIETVILGKTEVVKLCVVGLLARGHVLIEDVPGVGKTTLARALARSIDCGFQRIQFTPDLLPSDILGVSIYNTESNKFVFRPGPIFANVILADEVNRTTPRTQSSLLEAMNDFQVSVDGTTHRLPEPFIVLATQNPIEFAGTYPLPESQLDRFLLRIRVGYPSREHEREVLASQRETHPIDGLSSVLAGPDVLALQARVRGVRVDPTLADYILEIVSRTRGSPDLLAGVSPRGSLALYRAAQALALVEGRDYVLPDDIKALAVAVLAHRLIEKSAIERGTGGRAEEIVREILEAVPVPV